MGRRGGPSPAGCEEASHEQKAQVSSVSFSSQPAFKSSAERLQKRVLGLYFPRVSFGERSPLAW